MAHLLAVRNPRSLEEVVTYAKEYLVLDEQFQTNPRIRALDNKDDITELRNIIRTLGEELQQLRTSKTSTKDITCKICGERHHAIGCPDKQRRKPAGNE
jgi:hypothetical protein